MLSNHKKPKVLLVDDEQSILTALAFLMKQQNYEVKTAKSGEEGIRLWKSFQPELIILDVMMSGMDGYEVAKQIRNAKTGADVRIIFLTAKGATQDKMQGYGSGGDIYITKPFDNNALVQTVNELLVYD